MIKETTLMKQFGSYYPIVRTEHMNKILYIAVRQVLAENKIYTVYPLLHNMFRAFRETPLDEVKVVIYGQDPYHNTYNNKASACGLCFATENGYFNPSARIILAELERMGSDAESPEDFTRWAKQGVLMLNASLSVRAGQANSHARYWRPFTEAFLTALTKKKFDLVFLGMGKEAQNLIKSNIFTGTHIKVPHPMVDHYSGVNNFVGSKAFERVNEELIKLNKTPIIW
jgi:uracil-DNA glycosylase